MTLIREDDLTQEQTRALIESHFVDMHEGTPAGSSHALSVEGLQGPGITFWTAWTTDVITGMGALVTLDERNGEIKSMRTTEAARGLGIGRAMVQRIVAEARERGLSALWLETGSDDRFIAARSLYASEGFIECEAFGRYQPDPHSIFMTLAL